MHACSCVTARLCVGVLHYPISRYLNRKNLLLDSTHASIIVCDCLVPREWFPPGEGEAQETHVGVIHRSTSHFASDRLQQGQLLSVI